MNSPRMYRLALLCLGISVFCHSLLADERSEGRHQAKRVLLISVDGLHAIDLANYVKSHPGSTLGQLSRHGITYSNASTSKPSDSFPGLLALVTGGSPVSTGIWYDNSYDRALSPPLSFPGGSTRCTKIGTQVLYDETIDINLNAIDGGGGINPDNLPRDPSHGCTPVLPHSHLRVNTIFEVIKAAGRRTAWADKHLAYELVNGPSGKGVDDLFTPEIAANGDATKHINTTEANDDLKVRAILNEIDGRDHSGARLVGVPAVFGMNFQAISVAQKLAGNGYTDVLGTPSAGLLEALNHTDQSLGLMVSELQKRDLLESTLVVITAKHGQSPIDINKRQALDDAPYDVLLGGLEAFKTTDDVGLIWLTDSSQTNAAAATLSQPANENQLGIQEIFAGDSLKTRFNDPQLDSRTPDIIVVPNYGVIYTGGTKIAEHGGFSEDDTHVALLLSMPQMRVAQIKTAVETKQVAPTILRVLGLNPNDLRAVQIEKTSTLPGLSLSSDQDDQDDQDDQ